MRGAPLSHYAQSYHIIHAERNPLAPSGSLITLQDIPLNSIHFIARDSSVELMRELVLLDNTIRIQSTAFGF